MSAAERPRRRSRGGDDEYRPDLPPPCPECPVGSCVHGAWVPPKKGAKPTFRRLGASEQARDRVADKIAEGLGEERLPQVLDDGRLNHDRAPDRREVEALMLRRDHAGALRVYADWCVARARAVRHQLLAAAADRRVLEREAVQLELHAQVLALDLDGDQPSGLTDREIGRILGLARSTVTELRGRIVRAAGAMSIDLIAVPVLCRCGCGQECVWGGRGRPPRFVDEKHEKRFNGRKERARKRLARAIERARLDVEERARAGGWIDSAPKRRCVVCRSGTSWRDQGGRALHPTCAPSGSGGAVRRFLDSSQAPGPASEAP